MSSNKTKDGPLSELGLIDIRDLLVFRQSRDGAGEEYNNLRDLARAIAQNGLYHNLVGCRWGFEGIREYVETVSNLPGNSDYDVDTVLGQVKNRRKQHIVLIAGHRRRAAIQLIRKEGPDFLWDLEGYNGLSGEKCYRKIFAGGLVPVKIYQDIPPRRALGIQMDENLNRDEVPMPVQARAIQILYHLEKESHKEPHGAEKSLSVASFCREKGLSVSVVSNAISFREFLPQAIISAVERGQFKWGCAIELSKIARILDRTPKSDGTRRTPKEIENDLKRLAACEAAVRSVESFRKYLKTWVVEQCGQLTLDTDFELTADVVQHHLLDSKLVQEVTLYQHFLHKVEYAINNGWVNGGKLVPLHRREALMAVTKMLKAQEALNSLLSTIVEGEDFARLVELTEDNIRMAEQISLLAATN